MGATTTYAQERYHALREAGLCVTCKEPVEGDAIRCHACKKVARLKRRERTLTLHAPSTTDPEASLCGCARWDDPADQRYALTPVEVTCKRCLREPAWRLWEAFSSPATEPRWARMGAA